MEHVQGESSASVQAAVRENGIARFFVVTDPDGRTVAYCGERHMRGRYDQMMTVYDVITLDGRYIRKGFKSMGAITTWCRKNSEEIAPVSAEDPSNQVEPVMVETEDDISDPNTPVRRQAWSVVKLSRDAQKYAGQAEERAKEAERLALETACYADISEVSRTVRECEEQISEAHRHAELIRPEFEAAERLYRRARWAHAAAYRISSVMFFSDGPWDAVMDDWTEKSSDAHASAMEYRDRAEGAIQDAGDDVRRAERQLDRACAVCGTWYPCTRSGRDLIADLYDRGGYTCGCGGDVEEGEEWAPVEPCDGQTAFDDPDMVGPHYAPERHGEGFGGILNWLASPEYAAQFEGREDSPAPACWECEDAGCEWCTEEPESAPESSTPWERHPALVGPLPFSPEQQITELEPGYERVVQFGQEYRMRTERGRVVEVYHAGWGPDHACDITREHALGTVIHCGAFGQVVRSAVLVGLHEETRVRCGSCEPGWQWGRGEKPKARIRIGGHEAAVCLGGFHSSFAGIIPAEYTDGLSGDKEQAACVAYAAWVGGTGEKPLTRAEREQQAEAKRAAKAKPSRAPREAAKGAPKVGDIVVSGDTAAVLGHVYRVVVTGKDHAVQHVASGEWLTVEMNTKGVKAKPEAKRAIVRDVTARGEAQPEPEAEDAELMRQAEELAKFEAEADAELAAQEEAAQQWEEAETRPAVISPLADQFPELRQFLAPRGPEAPMLVLNLFSGPGGAVIALRDVLRQEVGRDVEIINVDLDGDCAATLRAAGFLAIQADVSKLDPSDPVFSQVQGVIITPPCTDYTDAGKRLGRLPENIDVLTDAWDVARRAGGFIPLGGMGDHPEFGKEIEHREPNGESWAQVRETLADDYTGPTGHLMLEVAVWGMGLQLAGAPLEWVAVEQSSKLPEEIRGEIAADYQLAGWAMAEWHIADAAAYGSPTQRVRALMVARRDSVTDVTMDAPGWSTGGAQATDREHGTPVFTRGVGKRTGGGNVVMLRDDEPYRAFTSRIRSVDVGEKGARFSLSEIARLIAISPDYPVQGSRTSVCQQLGDVLVPVVGAALLGVALGIEWMPRLGAYLSELYPDVHGQGEDAEEAEPNKAEESAEELAGGSVEEKEEAADVEPDITITHTRADGTTLEGSRKGDGVWEAVKPWFRYSRNVGIYIRGSRDKAADTWKINQAADAVRKLGLTVAVVIDEDTRRSFAEAEADRVERAEGRAERYGDRAGRAAATSNDLWDRHNSIGERFFMGQPILVGHHSEKRARRDQERMWGMARKSIHEQKRADYWANRAQASEAYERYRKNPGRTLRRIEKLEAERRGVLRERDGVDDKGRFADVWRKAPSEERRAELDRLIAEYDEELTYWAEVIAEAERRGFKVWGKADFAKGDYVLYRGTWYEVTRVNAKSLTIPHIHAQFDGGAAGSVGGCSVVSKASAAGGRTGQWTYTAPYNDGVSGRMSAEQMRAALAGEPIPAEEPEEIPQPAAGETAEVAWDPAEHVVSVRPMTKDDAASPRTDVYGYVGECSCGGVTWYPNKTDTKNAMNNHRDGHVMLETSCPMGSTGYVPEVEEPAAKENAEPVKSQPAPGLYAPVVQTEEREGAEAEACQETFHKYVWLCVEAEGVAGILRSYLTCACTGEKLGNFGRSGPSMSTGTQTRPLGIREASTASAEGVAKRNSYTTTGPWEIVSDTLKRCPARWDHEPAPAVVTDPAREKKNSVPAAGEPAPAPLVLEAAPVRAELEAGQRTPIVLPYVAPARTFATPYQAPQPNTGRAYWEPGQRVTLNGRAGVTRYSTFDGVRVMWDDAPHGTDYVSPRLLWKEGTEEQPEPRDWFEPLTAPAPVEDNGPDYAAISAANRAAAEPASLDWHTLTAELDDLRAETAALLAPVGTWDDVARELEELRTLVHGDQDAAAPAPTWEELTGELATLRAEVTTPPAPAPVKRTSIPARLAREGLSLAASAALVTFAASQLAEVVPVG